MKKAFLLIPALFFLSSAVITDNSTERIGVDGPLTFNKTNFQLVWTDKPKDTYYIQEYLPAGEKTENFNQMLTIHLFDVDLKAKDAVSQKINELKERQKKDVVCKYLVNESPDGKEFIVDFLLGESKDDNMTIVEFNVYRYKQIELEKKHKAILMFAYSKRAYGENITPFFSTLKDDRMNSINEMTSLEMPVVKLNGK